MNLAKKLLPDISGVYAAMATPFGDDGTPNLEAIDPVVDFLIGSGVDGLCVGGATGEYPVCSVKVRELLFRRVSARTRHRAGLIFGVGAGNASAVCHLAEVARECGGSAVLLPPPFYFRYDAGDVIEFFRALGPDLPLPVLLYNIPQFTNPFNLREALQLIRTIPNIVGIKDSSGRMENLPLLAEAKANVPMIYFSGDDSLLIDAFRHGADGAISGVASACPELLTAIEKIRSDGGNNYSGPVQDLLNEFITHNDPFPVPWGIKLAMESRGLQMGPLSWPVSPQMESRIVTFQHWFAGWLPGCLQACASSAPSSQ